MLALEHCSSIYRRQLFFVLFLFFFYGRPQEIIISRHNNKNVYIKEHWLILNFSGGDKDEGDADHMESLSRPVSGERTSSHDDNESVGSVRPASGASGSITGK